MMQLGFDFREPVQRPGSRGGRYYVTKLGNVRYGQIGAKFAGYFPTPKAASDAAVAAADIEPGMRVLEPSAGKGDMADAIRAGCPDCDIVAVELVDRLAEVSRARGHDTRTGSIFELTPEDLGPFDRVVMNPPFEGGADADHVRHAYDYLKPGGVLSAIMSEGTFFRTDAKAMAFREWLDEHGGEAERMPEGSFVRHESSDRTTGTRTRLVTVRKPTTFQKAWGTLMKAQRRTAGALDAETAARRGTQRNVEALAARRALIEQDLWYLEHEDLPEVSEDDPRHYDLLKARARLRGELSAVNEVLTKATWGGRTPRAVAIAARPSPALEGVLTALRQRGFEAETVETADAAQLAGADVVVLGGHVGHDLDEGPLLKAVAALLDDDAARKGPAYATVGGLVVTGPVDGTQRVTHDLRAFLAGQGLRVPPAAAVTVVGETPAGSVEAAAAALSDAALALRREPRVFLKADLALMKARRRLHGRRLHGRRRLDGAAFSIENRAGSKRHWQDADGHRGSTTMQHAYGYIRRSLGPDGDHVDCFLGPLAKEGQVEGTDVYVITTRKRPDFREVDEQKCMVGFPDAASARRAFLSHYDDPRFLGQIDRVSWEDFKAQAAETRHGGGLIRGEVLEHAPHGDRPRRGPLIKAHVKAHQRQTKGGATVQVAEHDDKRVKNPEQPTTGRPPAAAAPAGAPRMPAAPVAAPAAAGGGAGGANAPGPVGGGAPAPARQEPVSHTAVSPDEVAEHVDAYRPTLRKAMESLATAFPGVNVTGRLKETASLVEKLQRKGKDLGEIEDVAGTRLTFDSMADQQAAIARIRRKFTVTTEDDYLTRPKGGVYRSYHCILQVEGRPVELQVRTANQTRVADAMHDSLYKTSGRTPPPEMHGYFVQVSDYFACLDGGSEAAQCGQPPECPDTVAALGACVAEAG